MIYYNLSVHTAAVIRICAGTVRIPSVAVAVVVWAGGQEKIRCACSFTGACACVRLRSLVTARVRVRFLVRRFAWWCRPRELHCVSRARARACVFVRVCAGVRVRTCVSVCERGACTAAATTMTTTTHRPQRSYVVMYSCGTDVRLFKRQ